MKSVLLVFLGGGAGAVARWGLGLAVARWPGAAHWPWGTFAVNVLGGLAMGLLAGWLARAGPGGETWRLLGAVGFLGGFTTFSAVSLELVGMVDAGRIWSAFAYAALSVVAAALAAGLGLALSRTAL